jgi:putative addiction module antidote
MIHKVKIQPIGEALGAILPQDLLDNMNIGRDDELLAVPSDEGILLLPLEKNFLEAMEAFEVGITKYRQALRELAK